MENVVTFFEYACLVIVSPVLLVVVIKFLIPFWDLICQQNMQQKAMTIPFLINTVALLQCCTELFPALAGIFILGIASLYIGYTQKAVLTGLGLAAHMAFFFYVVFVM